MNNPSTTQLTHFIHSIEQAVSLDELDVMLVHACQALSIHRFILCEFIQTPIHKTLYAMTATHLKEWETFYQIEKKYDIIDPIYDYAAHTFTPFFWTPHTFDSLTLEQKEFFVDAEVFHITSGTTFALLPRLIKDLVLPFDNEGLPPPYTHHCFFTVLDRDLTHDLALIYQLSILGNAYNLKKETFAFQPNKQTQSRPNKHNETYKLLYTILKQGILSLGNNNSGHLLFKEIFRRGLLYFTQATNKTK